MNSSSLDRLHLFNLQSEAKAELLETSRWADQFGFSELEALSIPRRVYRAEAGDLVVAEGELEAFLCLVIRGAVEIVKLDSNGLSKSLARIGPGKTFGEMALIDGRPRSATVRAVSESTLMILDPEGLASLSDDKPRLALQFVLMIARDLSARLRRTSGMLVDYIGSGA
ncbi:MAG: cyclic nucleotide-binding domain-containing protein [Myxococcales bacterium]|nr:cyclic nucleotide-binding domain-containing protein [Myxococcales bacterium]